MLKRTGWAAGGKEWDRWKRFLVWLLKVLPNIWYLEVLLLCLWLGSVYLHLVESENTVPEPCFGKFIGAEGICEVLSVCLAPVGHNMCVPKRCAN